MRTEFAKLLKQIKKNHPESDDAIVRKAYRVADKAHQGQMRLSGEPYVSHTLAVANVLAGLGLDVLTISAGLLHDVLEDTPLTFQDLVSEFGKDVADLVEGVTKIGTLQRGASVPGSQEEKQAENLRKMLVATAKDVRVILIKLADRLHNLRTIEFHQPQAIERICRETLDIYAPVANRLGLSQWKWELEDHAFHFLHPNEYRETARMVAMKRREREEVLEKTMAFLGERLDEAEVHARVIGRPKHLYSIYQKMTRQGKTFDQVLDVMAMRIITQTLGGCYNALGVVHHLWRPVPGRFKDYIALPKLNMYQSIHTSVMLDDGKTLEIQIRTEEMDHTAREGIAAHWVYKEGVRTKGGHDHQLKWLRQMHDWLKDAHAPDELFDSMRRDIDMTDIYIFTPKGEIKELPRGATPLDFAYMVHSDVGHRCIGARVNGSMVPLRYHLQNGDIIEILTSKNQTPHMDWLDIVVTGRARTRIRQKLREVGELPALDDLEHRPSSPPRLPKRPFEGEIRVVDDATRNKLIRVEGHRHMEVQFARCCNPMPGHPIIGYVTQRKGITIHRADCRLLEKNEHVMNRNVAASWEGDEVIETAVYASVGARPNVLADITHAMRPMNLDITHAEYRPGDEGDSVFLFVFQTTDHSSVDRVLKTLRTVSGVTAVSTLPRPQKKKAAP